MALVKQPADSLSIAITISRVQQQVPIRRRAVDRRHKSRRASVRDGQVALGDAESLDPNFADVAIGTTREGFGIGDDHFFVRQ